MLQSFPTLTCSVSTHVRTKGRKPWSRRTSPKSGVSSTSAGACDLGAAGALISSNLRPCHSLANRFLRLQQSSLDSRCPWFREGRGEASPGYMGRAEPPQLARARAAESTRHASDKVPGRRCGTSSRRLRYERRVEAGDRRRRPPQGTDPGTRARASDQISEEHTS